MKPDYKNWMPRGMVLSSVGMTVLFLILFIIFGLTGIFSGMLKTVLFFVFLAATVFGIGISLWMILMYRTFSYDGDRQMSRQIIEGIADYFKLPEGGNGLDVGCGSGALGSGAVIAREVAEVTISAEDLGELVWLKRLSDALMNRINHNYRFVMGFNSALIALGALGVLTPSAGALLHNTSTIVLSMKCLTNLLNSERN